MHPRSRRGGGETDAAALVVAHGSILRGAGPRSSDGGRCEDEPGGRGRLRRAAARLVHVAVPRPPRSDATRCAGRAIRSPRRSTDPSLLGCCSSAGDRRSIAAPPTRPRRPASAWTRPTWEQDLELARAALEPMAILPAPDIAARARKASCLAAPPGARGGRARRRDRRPGDRHASPTARSRSRSHAHRGRPVRRRRPGRARRERLGRPRREGPGAGSTAAATT